MITSPRVTVGRRVGGVEVFILVCITSPGLHAQTGDSAAAAVAAAQAVATSWLGLIDRGQLGMSWDSAATGFRSAIARSSGRTSANGGSSRMSTVQGWTPVGRRALTLRRFRSLGSTVTGLDRGHAEEWLPDPLLVPAPAWRRTLVIVPCSAREDPHDG